MAKKVLKCKRMFDAENGVIVNDMYIFVDGNIIEKVAPISEVSSIDGYELMDMGTKFVSPGFTDAHTHIVNNGQGVMEFSGNTLGELTLRSLKNIEATMMAGFTSIRVVGDIGFNDVAIRDAINRGDFVGPRMVTAGPCIGTTGSHADSHYSPYISEREKLGLIADGADEMRKVARYAIKHGADMLKFMSTGGVMSKGTEVGAQQMTFEEMKAVVEIANMYGVTTATHAHGTNGIKDAVRAGVTSIEHGTMMDDECIEEMVKHGTYLVPTFIAPYLIAVNGEAMGIPKYAVEKTEQIMKTHGEGFRKAMAAGVKIAFGTDVSTPCSYHGKQALEFKLLLENGFTLEQALTSATKTASELLRKWDMVGSITVGKYADIIAFDGDPCENIEALMDCSFVMKDGQVVKG